MTPYPRVHSAPPRKANRPAGHHPYPYTMQLVEFAPKEPSGFTEAVHEMRSL